MVHIKMEAVVRWTSGEGGPTPGLADVEKYKSWMSSRLISLDA
jgi:hypothetical protein